MTQEQSKSIDLSLKKLSRQPLIANGSEFLTVTGGTAQLLTVPTGSQFAKIRAISATVDGSIVMYYSEYGATVAPTGGAVGTAHGMPLAYMDYFEIESKSNLDSFRVIAASGTHYLAVTYFKV